MYISNMDYTLELTSFTGIPPTWVSTNTGGYITVRYEYVEDLWYDEETDTYR